MRFNIIFVCPLLILLMGFSFCLAADQPAIPDDLSITPPDFLPSELKDTQPALETTVAAPQPTPNVPLIATNITLAQTGQTHGIILNGSNFQSGINFTLPSDTVITQAQLKLKLQVSPAIVARNASLILTMNGQPLGDIALKSGNETINTYSLEIPAALVVSNNNIGFKISSGEALLCEHDTSNKYQVKILPDTFLELEGQQLNISADLSHFPLPFFNKMQMSATDIAFIFPTQVNEDQVSAAALLASWFGIQADYHGVNIDARIDSLPEKNGILFGAPGQQIGSITFPASSSPYLKIIDNPGNPAYKLLLIAGTNNAELRSAAWRLVHKPFREHTEQTNISVITLPKSEPYDAPRWISTNHPVLLKDLLRPGESLVSHGIWHSPSRITFRAAPDLFLWDGENIPMQIKYRFPAEEWIDAKRSFLSIMLNNIFLKNLPVNKPGIMEHTLSLLGIDTRQERMDIPLNPYQIYGDNQLMFYFNIETREDMSCDTLLHNNIKSTISGDSWIDLSKTRHFSLLPNLSYFVGASFPFSRLADYSQTILLLSAKPTATEISILMNLAARAGATTGTTLNHNQVVFGVDNATALTHIAQNDVLAVSSLQQQAFYRALLTDSPFVSDDQTINIRQLTVWQKAWRWITGDWSSDGVNAERYLSSNNAWRGFISYPSPWSSQHVVVVAVGSDDDQLARLPADLNNADINANIRGDLAIITGSNAIRSFRVGPQFTSGELPWYLLVIWYASQHAALLAILGVLFSCLFGLSLYVVLKQRAHRRLHPPQSGDKR